jgi:hypothetical protein
MEKLSGRLLWENTATGICVEIPARSSGEHIFLYLMFVAFTTLAILYRRAILPGDQASAFAWFNVALGVGGVLLLAGLILWNFTGRTVVTVNPSGIRLERRVAGLQWDTRTFRVDQVHGLRFIPPYSFYKYRSDHYPSKMEFFAGRKRCRFAQGISEREACALVDCINSVSVFAKTNV